jgi:hypothetical protein
MLRILFIKLILQQLLKGDFDALNNFRYYTKWKNSLQPGHNSLTDRLPWLTFPAIEMLEKKLGKDARVFEYGGGGSTLFFLDRVSFVTTVEHNQEWFDFLKAETDHSNKKNWEAVLILPEEKDPAIQLDFTNPDHYYSGDANYADKTFKSYASYIDRYEDAFFDAVLIDGRTRPSCLKHAVKKVKKGGLLLMDNAERKYYLANSYIAENNFKLVLNKMAPIPFINFYSQTNIWVKQ